MRDLAALAEQIRTVRAAQRQFVTRWRLEQVLVGADVLDQLADDMAAAHAELDLSADDAAGDFAHPAAFADEGGFAKHADFNGLSEGFADADGLADPAAGGFGYLPPHRWSMYSNGGADAAS
ncbi:MAG: hypothetical protein JWO31_1326 [Phycisphaerales bacterium]|nr:hypothetical protein [Phycisphaerales bacterium]